MSDDIKVVCHGDTRVAPSKDGEDPYAEPKARGIFFKVNLLIGITHNSNSIGFCRIQFNLL